MTTRTPTGAPTSTAKTTENRLRRMAQRQGLRLEKSRRRDPRALSHGTYRLIDPATSAIVAGNSEVFDGYGLNIAEVADYLDPTAENLDGAKRATHCSQASPKKQKPPTHSKCPRTPSGAPSK
ncbi:MAG: hypothetical protein FGM52_13155 [Mycobacterium sp.]|nr:hypothetical protein [Mycobacterium sp.]